MLPLTVDVVLLTAHVLLLTAHCSLLIAYKIASLTAEVVFTRKPDAIAVVKRYNNVQLDGKPMKIEMIGTNLNSVAPAV